MVLYPDSQGSANLTTGDLPQSRGKPASWVLIRRFGTVTLILCETQLIVGENLYFLEAFQSKRQGELLCDSRS